MITQQEHDIIIRFAHGHPMGHVAYWSRLQTHELRDIIDRLRESEGININSLPALREWLPGYQTELAKAGPRYRLRLAEVAGLVAINQANAPAPEQPQQPSTPTLADIRARAQAKREALYGSPLIPLEQTIVDALREGMSLKQIEGNMILERQEFATLVETIKAKLGELPSGDESPGCRMDDEAFQ